MKKKSLLFIVIILTIITGLKAQKVYEFDNVQRLPSLDEKNMNIISTSIQKLFKEIIKDPLKYSSSNVTKDTVFTFYDDDYRKKIINVEALNGKQYTVLDSSRLRLNQISSYNKEPETRLLFNLTFNENGKINIPEKITIISYRKEDVVKNKGTFNSSTTIEKVGLLAFEINLTDDIKNNLSQVKLKSIAGIDINSLSGELKPVTIKCPFLLHYGSSNSRGTYGHLTKKKNKIDISLKRYFKDEKEKDEIIKLIKEQTDILTYKSGEFDFTIVTETNYLQIEFNLVADNVVVNRASKNSSSSNSTETKKVISFIGEGKKIK